MAVTQYFITDPGGQRTCGPFDKDDFAQKRAALSVNAKLKLADPAKYRSRSKKP